MRRKLPFRPNRNTFGVAPVPVNFAVIAHVRGHISVDRLRAALAKVREKHVFIAGYLMADDEGGWYSTENVPDFPIREIQGDWAAEVATNLNVTFDGLVGPMVRFIIARSDDHTDLVMICHHGFADGLSAAYVLRDILTFMADPDCTVEALPVKPIMDEMIPPFDPETMHFDLNAPSQNKHIHGAADHERSEIYILPSALTEHQTVALATCCREEQTSVHAAICTAFLVAQEQLDGPDHSTLRMISSPVNMRSQLPDPIGEQFGIYISPGIRTTLDCSSYRTDQAAFWGLAREFKASFIRDNTFENALKPLYFFRYISHKAATDKSFHFMRNDSFAEYDLSITNLGRLNFPVDYGDLCLEAIYGPVVNPLGREKVMGVSTVGNTLTMTFTAPYVLMDRPVAEKLIEIAKAELGVAVGW